MVTFSAAPIDNPAVARIEPFALKALLTADKVYLHHLFTALGFGRVFDQTIRNTDEAERTAFFSQVIAESASFQSNAGLYITDDIVNITAADAVIAKISVTDENISDAQRLNGGVAAFIIPSDETLNSLLITSGGISNPAFVNGVGVSVLTTENAFHNFAETLYTLSSIVFGDTQEFPDTEWAEGKNIAFTIYKGHDGQVTRLYQLVLQKVDGELVTKEADANDDGYIPLKQWEEFTGEESNPLNFTNYAQNKLADVLNSSISRKVSLSVISESDDGSGLHKEANRFIPIELDGELVLPHTEDVYGVDEHPVHNDEVLEDFIADTEAAPIWDTPNEEISETVAEAPLDIDSELFDTVEYVPTDLIDSAEEDNPVDTVQELVEFAEQEVANSAEPEVHSDVNDPTAETAEPFILGAEYLINDGADNDVEAVFGIEVPVEESVVSLEEVVSPEAENVIPLEDIASTEQAVHYENLQWSEVLTGDIELPPENTTEEGSTPEFSDITWDEVALTVADDDSNNDAQPLRGFLDRN